MSNFATVMETTPQPHLRLTALRAAFPYTVPIFAGFWFMGLAYGLLMSKSGFAFYWPMLMAMTIFSGSVEFVAVKLLLGSFQPLQSFLIALFICARHLFYGISMLDKFKGMGWKKLPLIYAMCDETFSVNYTAHIPQGVDRGWFMLWVTVLDYVYWVTGATLGGLIGQWVTFSTKGLDFVMTAMFTVIFLNQWEKDRQHYSALIGLAAPLACLVFFGSGSFLLPSMGCILILLLALRRPIEKAESPAEETGEVGA